MLSKSWQPAPAKSCQPLGLTSLVADIYNKHLFPLPIYAAVRSVPIFPAFQYSPLSSLTKHQALA